jgi:hypothetical protein
VASNAFSISKKTAAVDTLLLKFKVTWSVSSMRGTVACSKAKLLRVQYVVSLNVPLN